MISGIFDILVEIINNFGYIGILVATGMEYACFPISSELLLPFIGYTISKGEMNLIITILVSTLGGIVGSLFCYCVGRLGGNFIEKTICKRFKTAALGIANAKKYFDKYGKQSVMIGRIFPIIRTYISIPAGMAKMDATYFTIYTGIGAFIWNTLLISSGYYLGEHWDEVKMVLKSHSNLIYVLIFLLVVLIIFRYRKKRKIQ